MATIETTSEVSFVGISVSNEELALIKHVAELDNKTVSDLVCEAALRETTEILLDQSGFELGDSAWEKLQGELDAPLVENARLRDLLARKPVWKI